MGKAVPEGNAEDCLGDMLDIRQTTDRQTDKQTVYNIGLIILTDINRFQIGSVNKM